MDALLIIAHGSKIKTSNDEIVNIANKIRDNYNEDEMLVLHAFLELSDPSIFHALNKAVSHGCKKVKIFPYFLAAGKHVKEDIPSEVKIFRKKYPEIEFILLPHIGLCTGIENMIISNI